MSSENKISVGFSTEEITKIKNAIAEIAGVLKGKMQSLTPNERKTFGRVKYEKEIWIDKVKQHMDSHPTKIPAYIDKAEFDKDYTLHKQLNELIPLLEMELQQMKDTNLLAGYDLDAAALVFYRVMKVAAANNDPGSVTIYEDLKRQYPGGKRKSAPVEKEDTPTS